MRPVRFVHCADLHLEAPFAGVDASDASVRAALVASTFTAFERVVSLCIEETVDFLLIAGDVYDNARNFNAQLQMQKQAERLEAAGIPVYVVEGNHDPESSRPHDLRLPGNVHYFSTRSVERICVTRDGETVCALYGRGYAKAAETRDLAAGFVRSPEDPLAIGILHTNVGGREGYEDYAPCSLDELRSRRMDYWALGHIHKPEVLSQQPAIVYAGSPQGRSPKDDGVRGCYLVELTPGHAELTFVPTCTVTWYRRTLDVTGAETLEDVRDVLHAACDELRSLTEGPSIVRFELTGRTPAHAALVRGTNLNDLVRELRDDEAGGNQWVWADRVTDRTAALIDVEELRDAQDFSGDLVRLADELERDPALLASLVATLTAPIEASLGTLDLEMTPEQLLQRARDVCLDRLEGEAR